MSTNSDRRSTLGFDSTRGTKESFGCFTLSAAQNSLFGSTRFQHSPVFLTDERAQVRLPVILDLARPVFLESEDEGEMPDWYFEGWILDPGRAGVRRVRIYVSTLSDDVELAPDDIFTWQVIEEADA